MAPSAAAAAVGRCEKLSSVARAHNPILPPSLQTPARPSYETGVDGGGTRMAATRHLLTAEGGESTTAEWRGKNGQRERGK